MTTTDQREEHKKQAVLNGYRTQATALNALAVQSIRAKYPQYETEFNKVDESLTKRRK